MIVTAVLFINETSWKQPKRPPVNELNTQWSIRTVEYHTAVKKNEEQLYELIWSNFLNILLSEKEAKHERIFTVCTLHVRKKNQEG